MLIPIQQQQAQERGRSSGIFPQSPRDVRAWWMLASNHPVASLLHVPLPFARAAPPIVHASPLGNIGNTPPEHSSSLCYHHYLSVYASHSGSRLCAQVMSKKDRSSSKQRGSGTMARHCFRCWIPRYRDAAPDSKGHLRCILSHLQRATQWCSQPLACVWLALLGSCRLLTLTADR